MSKLEANISLLIITFLVVSGIGTTVTVLSSYFVLVVLFSALFLKQRPNFFIVAGVLIVLVFVMSAFVFDLRVYCVYVACGMIRLPLNIRILNALPQIGIKIRVKFGHAVSVRMNYEGEKYNMLWV